MRQFAVLVAIYLWISMACHAANQEPNLPDNFGHISANNLPSLPLETLTGFKPRRTTLSDIHKVFGLQESDRLTFKKTLLPKTRKGHQYNVYRLISYTAFSMERKDYGKIVESSWKESINVTFFFDRGDTLLFYTVRHRHHDGDGKTWAGKHHDFEKASNEFWPGAICDGIFHNVYETQRYPAKWGLDLGATNKCTWMDKLKADVAAGVVK